MKDIINSDGQYTYAYVTFVIKSNIYASSAIILANSIRKMGCIGDLVVLIDEYIDENTIDLLKNFYNKIITLDNVITINNNDNIQKIILTKLESLKLVQYEKILLLDVETIIFSDIDTCFNSNPPSILYTDDNINTGLILLKPNKSLYNEIISLIDKHKTELETNIKPLRYILKKTFTKINNIGINICINKFDEKSDGIQYTIDKPFLMSSDKTIERRTQLNHFKIWYMHLTDIFNKYPNFKKYNCLNEPFKIAKYFLSVLSRFRANYKNKIQKNINKKNLHLHHLNISREYSDKTLNYNINCNNIHSFIRYIQNLHIQTNFNFNKYEGSEYSKITMKDFLRDLINEQIPNNILFWIIKYYIRFFQNSFLVLSFEKSRYMENNQIYNIKIILDGLALKNIIFNIYQIYVYEQRINYLKDIDISKKYEIYISIYEMMSLLEMFDEYIQNDTLLIVEQETKLRASSIFFNENTLNRFIDKKINIFTTKLNNILKINYNALIRLLFYQSLKKWLYNIYIGEEIDNILILRKNKNIYILDNNNHNEMKIKYINDICFKNYKIYFIPVIKNDIFENITNETLITYIYDLNMYWELDGIKFYEIET